MRKRRIAQVVALFLIVSGIGIGIGFAIPWFPASASSQADDIDTVYYVLVIASVPMFVLVAGMILYSVWKFRVRPGQEDMDGPPIHGDTRLELAWTAVPAALLFGLAAYAGVTLHNIEKPAPNEMTVAVTGQQFAWHYSYPQAGAKPVESTQLYLPEGRPVRFVVHSKDVIHDFWVPAFRLKTDAVPGIATHIRVDPIKAGTYPVVCAELCGLGHSTMRSTVHVVSPAAFKTWLSQQEQSAGKETSS